MNPIVRNRAQFHNTYLSLVDHILAEPLFDRGEVHAQKVVKQEMKTRELRHLVQDFDVPEMCETWQRMVEPNLPWAEDHFKERIDGRPFNPPPSNEWWPYAQAGNAEHKKGDQFSHTYPERFWPKFANTEGTTDEGRRIFVPHVGIRFEYGELMDIVKLLHKNPRTRQAYLPVWFPEDLTAARKGERVPCTLGYHFLLNPKGELDVTYYMRSCDLVRFWRDDVYMAGRLLQWVAARIRFSSGTLRLCISSLHCFDGDTPHLEQFLADYDDANDQQWGQYS